MRFERGIRQYFKRAEEGGYYLRRTHTLENGRLIEAIDEHHVWSPRAAKSLAKIMREADVAPAPEQLLKREAGIE